MKTTFSLLLGLIFITGCSKRSEVQSLTTDKNEWWKEAIVYQIYPRSFMDSNGDGIGDLNGITSKLDYIKNLGVTAVWLNPVYSSPNRDNGYDVSDYQNIMGEFGTMQDFDAMLKEMHDRNIKVIMDIVVNHSSDEHPWFKQSRSSRDNPYRNYYHWWPREKGTPPYRYSLFDEKGDAWQYDSTTDSYYLHYFSDHQPDLNWSNPKVRDEVNNIMKFWAEKGVDGFRLDAFQFAAKDTTFPKFPDGFEKRFIDYYAMQEGIHEYLRGMNDEVFSKYNVMSVAEGAGRNFQEAHALVDEDRKELNMAYAFDGVDIARYEGYDLVNFKKVFSRWDSAFQDKGWLSIFLANHDQARMVSRFGSDKPEFREAASTMLNTFILTMRGTPYLYYGDELAMTNIYFTDISQFNDIAAINSYKKADAEGQNMTQFMKKLSFESRDNGRTPMQWSAQPNAGFSNTKPWLPVNPNFEEINADAQIKNENSPLNYFKKLTALRKSNPVLVYGSYELLIPSHPEVYAYKRTLENKVMIVVMNFSKNSETLELPEIATTNKLVLTNYDSVQRNTNTLVLKPYQAVILANE